MHDCRYAVEGVNCISNFLPQYSVKFFLFLNHIDKRFYSNGLGSSSVLINTAAFYHQLFSHLSLIIFFVFFLLFGLQTARLFRCCTSWQQDLFVLRTLLEQFRDYNDILSINGISQKTSRALSSNA